VEEVNANNMNNRISSKNIFGHAGSATRDQALAMLQVSEGKRMAAVDAAAAKKNQAKEKKARGTTALFATGSEILKRLEQLGPSPVRIHMEPGPPRSHTYKWEMTFPPKSGQEGTTIFCRTGGQQQCWLYGSCI